MQVYELFEKPSRKKPVKESVAPAQPSQWGSTEEICRDLLQHLERDVEWRMTEIMDPRQVSQLLGPVINAVNNILMAQQGDR
jgi:hypothetical protein